MTVELKSNVRDPIIAKLSSNEDLSSNLQDQVKQYLDKEIDPVQIDCSNLNRVTSSYINELWKAREDCRHAGATFELINVSDGLRRVLEALDLAEILLPQIYAPINFKQKIAPTIEAIDIAMGKVVSFLLRSGLPEITSFELQTIFYEVSTNIRRHGELNSDDMIDFEVQISDKIVTYNYSDNGIFFDPTNKKTEIDFDHASKSNQRNGFGLAMIERLSDSVEYWRTDDNRNIIKITKKW